MESFTFSESLIDDSSCQYIGEEKKTKAQVVVEVLGDGADKKSVLALAEKLKKLDHENFAKVLAYGVIPKPSPLEGKWALVTEKCNGKSLHEILKHSPNGLNENDFLLLVKCLRNCVQQLCRNNLIILALNPNNIFEHECENGRMFKIALDLNIERSDKEWERSDYAQGLPTYWHPRQIHLFQSSQATLSIIVSRKEYITFWSTGVTLYKAATSRDLFQLYQTTNFVEMEETLRRAYDVKQPHQISGKESENGDWEFSESLPTNIQIKNRALLKCMTKLLVDLLQKEGKENCLSLDQFLQRCDEVLNLSEAEVLKKYKNDLLKISSLEELMQQCKIISTNVESVPGSEVIPSKSDGIYVVKKEEMDAPNVFKHYTWDERNNKNISNPKQGSYAKFYQGKNIKTGECVGVKEFKEGIPPKEGDHLKIDHPNIVKVIDSGCVTGGRAKGRFVVITEYLEEGDLNCILKRPENQNGLCENDFIELLDCLYHAFKHFQDKKLLHRDIKPQNICATKKDGKLVFKLIDFGEVVSTDNKGKNKKEKWTLADYNSGTDNYSHARLPKMRSCGTDEEVTQTDKKYIDLFSIGCTLFKAATGKHCFPTRDADREKAKEMLGNGVIYVDDGFKTYKKLPGTNQLNQSLQDALTLLLQNLLQYDRMKISDRKFYDQCEKILGIKKNSDIS